MPSTSMVMEGNAAQLGHRTECGWVRGLGKLFRHVALFRVDGVLARVAAVHGMGPPPLGTSVSLLDPTPLRWAVEAASPVIGAGSAPGGALLAARLGLSTPRAFAVIPLVTQGRLSAFAYVDQASEPLPVAAAGDLFTFCSRVLAGAPQGCSPSRTRSAVRSTRSRPRGRQVRGPVLLQPLAPRRPLDSPASALPACTDVLAVVEAPACTDLLAVVEAPACTDLLAVVEAPAATDVLAGIGVPAGIEALAVAEPLAVFQAGACSEHATAERLPAFVAPDAIVAASAPPRRRPLLKVGVAGAAVVAILLAALMALAPPPGSGADKLVQIPRAVGVAQIASHLQASGIIRSATAFQLAARLTGIDHHLKAGAYRLPQGVWAWTVLGSLHRGQVHTRTVTVPEGLTLPEVASLLEQQGLARATDILREAHEPSLLARYGIAAPSAEGFLFPETYTLARGLTAREILSAMLDEFHARVRALPGAAELPPERLLEAVTLASLVEREARDRGEQARVAGVFKNRLDRGMRLESCATVQYLLAKPKARLTLADVRQPSPYNTYLHPGLPPGPIANPGLDAIAAALAPETHAYLFFFARDDGTHRHVFSRTYAEHVRRQKQAQGR